MDNKLKTIRIYLLNQPLLYTEWTSLLGDKYRHAFPFSVEFTSDISKAQVVAWDGIVTLKMRPLKEHLLEQLKNKKILLVGEASTLFANHPFVELQDLRDMDVTHISGWTVLPEELLEALETCYKKLVDV